MATDGDPPPPPPPPPPPSPPPPRPRGMRPLSAFDAKKRETYPGENEEREQIGQLITDTKPPEIVYSPGRGIQVHQEQPLDQQGQGLEEQYDSPEEEEEAPEEQNPVGQQEEDEAPEEQNPVGQDEEEEAPEAQNPIGQHEEEEAPEEQNPVGQHEDENAGVSLETLIGENRWEGALQRLERMVRDGEAINGPVPDAPSHDIYRAHPELVLLLRGEEYLRIKNSANAAAATRFYGERIQNLYRSGKTGSSFVDTGVLKHIQDWENGSRATPLGHQSEIHMEETRQAVNDYLKLYFPSYRPKIGRVRGRQLSWVWELGEKLRNNCRCLACHRRFKSWSVTNLRNHLQGSRKKDGEQCPAKNDYLLNRLQELLILDEKGKNKPPTDQEGQPPPPHHHNDGDGDDDDDGAAPAPPAAAALSAAS